MEYDLALEIPLHRSSSSPTSVTHRAASPVLFVPAWILAIDLSISFNVCSRPGRVKTRASPLIRDQKASFNPNWISRGVPAPTGLTGVVVFTV